MSLNTVDLILVLVTLCAAIVGTATNPSRRIKIAIVGLAALTSVGTLIKAAESTNRDRINRRLIVALVQASNPPEHFSHDLVRALSPLLGESSQFVSQQIVDDDGERILVLATIDDGSEPSGILYFSPKQMNPVFYEYAVDGEIERPLKDHLNYSWTDCHEHWDECLAELSAIAHFAMDIAPIEVTGVTASMSDDMSFVLTSTNEWQGRPIEIAFDSVFIENLYGLSPSDRGLRILNAGQEQVIDGL